MCTCGRQLLELTSVTVDVQIDERVARTRTDQVFTNRADRVVEGIYELHWDGRDDDDRPLASGTYLYRLVTTDGTVTRKLTLLR